MLKRIVSRIKTNSPLVLNYSFPEAAVLLLVTDEAEPHIILTKRSEDMKTHSGQVAFPGGMKDKGDASLLETALRETEEEIGIEQSKIEIIGKLSQVVSKYRIKVTPYVGIVAKEVEVFPCPQELHSVFRVPVGFFKSQKPDRIDRLGFDNFNLKVPCWHYGNYEIWGMSAIILMDFYRTVFDFTLGDGTWEY